MRHARCFGNRTSGGTRIERVIIGTTHFANAFIEQKGLLKVAVVRLAGNAAAAVPPMSGWPDSLKQKVGGPCSS